MNIRRTFLRIVYPLFLPFSRIYNGRVLHAPRQAIAHDSIYNIELRLGNQEMVSMKRYQGRKLLLVNTASDCGYTPQYATLEKLASQYRHELQVIAFPSNDFKNQERGSDQEIAEFCEVNYKLGFPLAGKAPVLKGIHQQEIYQWLTTPEKNGWNDQQPWWNFTKYLVNEEGQLTHVFGPAISPLSKKITRQLKK